MATREIKIMPPDALRAELMAYNDDIVRIQQASGLLVRGYLMANNIVPDIPVRVSPEGELTIEIEEDDLLEVEHEHTNGEITPNRAQRRAVAKLR